MEWNFDALWTPSKSSSLKELRHWSNPFSQWKILNVEDYIYPSDDEREDNLLFALNIVFKQKKKKPNKEKLKNWQSSFNNFTFRLNQVGYSSLAFLTIMNSLESPLPAKKTNPTSYDSSLASSFFC